MDLTKEIENLATRHNISQEAIITLVQALTKGGNTMAQFNHPEFGGAGQWMQGGMTMIGDMFNLSLQAKVQTICNELSVLLKNQSPGSKIETLFPDLQLTNHWWPSHFGKPSMVGEQNQMRYAYFPTSHRLVIQYAHQTKVYNTLHYRLTGVAQQQSKSNRSLIFTSQQGIVNIEDLPQVTDNF